ncbi:glutathione-dependent disulfide-bond oxidoreductase [Reinekea forsetii]|jgi:GST-like protein|uniref:Glutathione S-transferase n=1 Tax=Reinekea forsetii TaxID=1336806 RepID=A0A2K8KJZ8_9GAMM|nr:glutathione-dependent disulfide-bond oxidoreductase [Reinekea forsetii]ATX75340.1 glutathione S-transferase [Reinekea forsetii]MDO7644925.1 glutathione-dependent disulfide-bond oxidoreductase [Reinekea forsetii]
MSADDSYIPPKVWQWHTPSGGNWANINRPISGATHDKVLEKGQHPFQLYSLATPNGVKVTIMFEELLALGIKEAEYDAYLINIGEGDQFGSDFVNINPNSKIPALLDQSKTQTVPIFESGSILFYLAEKFQVLIPTGDKRTQCMSWLFWQMGSAPYLGGGFGHFYSYAPEKFEYCIDRFSMEVKRQLDVLDKHLAHNDYICGDEYSIADIAIWPWYGALALNRLYDAAEFLDLASYQHLMRWAKQIDQRPAVKRGVMVNKAWGELSGQLHERHDASDFTERSQDKITKK